MTFRGDRLRQLREQRKAATRGREGSQTWVANRVGSHVTSVSDWERGDNEPSGRYVAALSHLFGVDASYLYGNDEDDEEAAPMEDLMRAIRRLVRDEIGAAR